MTAHLLRVDDLTKHFQTPSGTVHALDGVTLEIAPGETLGLVGESGCGKSTLGKTLVRLYEPDAGHVELAGVDISHLRPAELRPLRQQMQMIFQDPFASLNPRATVARILEEPMIVHRTHGRAERKARVAALMQRVGLRPEQGARLPHEFSGGQRQRIGIARALALSPKLVICDELLQGDRAAAVERPVRADPVTDPGDLGPGQLHGVAVGRYRAHHGGDERSVPLDRVVERAAAVAPRYRQTGRRDVGQRAILRQGRLDAGESSVAGGRVALGHDISRGEIRVERNLP